MPPAPMAAEISYGPNFVPGFNAIVAMDYIVMRIANI
jgi:hypothetical protein